MFLGLLIFFTSLFFFLIYNVHYLFLLLLLESMLLSVFVLLCWSFFVKFGLTGMFLFLLVVVCMGGFSISLLASLSRVFGRDFGLSGFVF